MAALDKPMASFARVRCTWAELSCAAKGMGV